jgi:2-polyprenyl-3-methyl-5-hydroxy-6-metoxy-1,4-benzoquinol methylase
MNYEKMEWTPEMVKRFWDYESQRPENYFTYQVGDKVALLLRKYVSQGGSILDVGCGRGYMVPHLLEMGYQVMGVENSPQSIDLVREKYGEEAGFLGVMPSEDLGSIDTQFNAVILLEVIEHIEDDEVDGLLQFVASKLRKDGGILFISCPNSENLENEEIYCPCCEKVYHRWQHVQSWSGERLSKRLEKNGFSVVDVVETDISQLGNKKYELKQALKKILRKKNVNVGNNLFVIAQV